MINKTELDITKNWIGNITQPKVSITCVTYNHEKYISKALDSFLMQETTFPFEILIHDDASTDATTFILKTYVKKFPRIIKPIYQQENQYSKGFNTMAILFPKVKGEYIAFCDGDDYWIDRHKLQIQIREMDFHHNVDMSFHPANALIDDTRNKIVAKHHNANKIFTLKEILVGGGAFCPTASLVFRKRVLDILPDWIYTTSVGDYPMQLIGSLNSGALYINKVMSLYRANSIASWSNGTNRSSMKRFDELLFSHQVLTSINELASNTLRNEINDLILKRNLNFLKQVNINLDQKIKIFDLYKNTLPIQHKVLWYSLYQHNAFHQKLSKFKNAFFIKKKTEHKKIFYKIKEQKNKVML